MDEKGAAGMELAILERQKCTMVKPQAYLRAEKTKKWAMVRPVLGRHIHEPPEMVVRFSVVSAFKWLHNGNVSKWSKTQNLRTGKVNL